MEIKAYLFTSSAFPPSTLWFLRLHQTGKISEINTEIHLKDQHLNKTETRGVFKSLNHVNNREFVCREAYTLQKPEFYYPKPELHHAAFCSRRRPVLSIDVVQTQERAVGTDRLLTKEVLGVSHQAALLPLPRYSTVTSHPTEGDANCRNKGPRTEHDHFQVGRWFNRSSTKSLLQGLKYNKIN